jgi:BirA family transcriptional regulator, biotin operon repressor / biotin---[acetyl-CoA-carboxylase] ligase
VDTLDPPWRELRHLEVCTSTNDVLREAARAGEPSGLVVISDAQTAGRGRADRAWATLRGGLALSVLTRPTRPRSDWVWLPLMAGLAVRDAAHALGAEAAVVKWPNDVLVDGRKLAGLLAEVEGDAVVLGVGMNIAVAPEGAAAVAGPRERVAAEVLDRLGHALTAWELGGDVREAYRAACATVGQQVRVELPGGEVVTGVAETVDDSGCLVVAGRPLSAGDVIHVRPA